MRKSLEGVLTGATPKPTACFPLSFHSLVFLTAWSPGQGFCAPQKPPHLQPEQKQWAQAEQVVIRTGDCKIIFCTNLSIPFPLENCSFFLLSLLLSQSLSPSAFSDLLNSHTLANTQFYCNVWYNTV